MLYNYTERGEGESKRKMRLRRRTASGDENNEGSGRGGRKRRPSAPWDIKITGYSVLLVNACTRALQVLPKTL